MLGSYLDLGNPVGDSPLNDKLASWWLALPGRQGYKFLDLRGAYHGTLTGGPSWVGGGRPGGWGALSFDGTDDLCTVTGGGLWSLSGGQTVSFWYRPRYTIADGLVHGILHQGAGANQLQAVKFDDGNLYVGVDGGNRVSPAASTVLTKDAWHHLTLVLESGPGATLYKNGVSVANNPGVTITWTDVTDAEVGRCNGAFATADFDDVRRVARPLSAAEVYALYEDSARGHPLTLRRFTRRTWLMSPPAAGGAQTATPGAADVTVSGLAPAASGTGTAAATPGVAAVTVTGVAPAAAASGAVTVTPGVAAVAVSGVSPAASGTGAVTATPGVGTVAVSGVNPAVAGTGAGTAAPGVAVVAVSGVAPSASAGFSTAVPGAAAATVTGLAPGASAPGVARATPGVGTVAVSALAPSAVPGPVTLSPGVGAAAVTALAPSASPAGPATASPGAVAVAVAGANPDASGAGALALTPGAAAVAVTASAPEAGFPGIRPTFRRQLVRGRSGAQVVKGRDADQRVRGV